MYSVCISGICLAVTTLTSRMHARGDYSGIKRLVMLSVTVSVILVAILALPVIIYKNGIAEFVLGNRLVASTLPIMTACIMLTAVENILKSMFHGIKTVKYPAASEIIEQLIRMAAVVLLLVNLKNGDPSRTALLIVTGMTLSEVFSVTFLLICYRKVFSDKKTGTGPRGILREMLKIYVPTACMALCGTLFSSAATVLFPQRLEAAGFSAQESVSALGVVNGMALPLIMLPVAVISALSTVLLPHISGSFSAGNTKQLQVKITKSMQVTGLIALPLTAMLVPMAPRLCELLFGHAIEPLTGILLGVFSVVTYFTIVINAILFGMSQNKYVLFYSLIGDIVMIFLVYVLTALPRLSVNGYIIALFSGDILSLLLSVWHVIRITGISFDPWRTVCVPVLSGLVLYCFSRFFFSVLSAMIPGGVWAALGSVAFCALMFIATMQLLEINPVSYIKRKL